MNNLDEFVKILLVGDSKVGKTSLMFRFTDDIFTEHECWKKSLYDYRTKTIKTDNHKNIKMQIWHARRHERFHTMTSSLASRCHGASAIMFLYDVTNGKTFDHVTGWLRLIGRHVGDHVVRVVVGNKGDLGEGRVVAREKGVEVARQHGADFFEVSAKDGGGVEEAFRGVVDSVMERRRKMNQDVDDRG